MGSADRYADGEWNFYCDLCGRKNKSSQAMKTWKNTYVCKHHKEVRNPQDFVKGVRDAQAVPWTRPEGVAPTAGGSTPILDLVGAAILDTTGVPIFDI